ncbi:hypothetical protein C1H46_043655 [Malus baccata]|uniref:Uncharacterized protein n=1 Tax=Malus baccata TaxID=106549 RepID=A0A540K993_MALBA|nr:hypothetical protein C1H46_043655 [Malus baccata]
MLGTRQLLPQGSVGGGEPLVLHHKPLHLHMLCSQLLLHNLRRRQHIKRRIGAMGRPHPRAKWVRSGERPTHVRRRNSTLASHFSRIHPNFPNKLQTFLHNQNHTMRIANILL